MTTDFDIEIDPAQMRAGDPRSTNSRKALLTRLRLKTPTKTTSRHGRAYRHVASHRATGT
jgi:hypothetical protein